MVLSSSLSSSPSRLTQATRVHENVEPPNLDAKPDRAPPVASQQPSQQGPNSLKRKNENLGGCSPARTVNGARNSAYARIAQTRRSKGKPVAHIASRNTGGRGRPSANRPQQIHRRDVQQQQTANCPTYNGGPVGHTSKSKTTGATIDPAVSSCMTPKYGKNQPTWGMATI